MNKRINQSEPTSFLKSELEAWPMADENFTRINNSVNDGRRSTLTPAGSSWRIDKMLVNHRRASITAKTDAASISDRPCFLCASNRPQHQSAIPFMNEYEILVNPFPLAEKHFTVPSTHHEPQTLDADGKRITDMSRLAEKMEGLCVFYNGATCGASAPDHFHFQAVSVDAVPNITDNTILGPLVISVDNAVIHAADDTTVPYPFFIIESSDSDSIRQAFCRLWGVLGHIYPDKNDPAVNIAMFYNRAEKLLRTIVIPRRCHRPECYFAQTGNMLISPATIEMLGTVVCSRQEDFDRLDLKTATDILKEVCIAPDIFEKAVEMMVDDAIRYS